MDVLIKKISWKEALPVRHKVLWPHKDPQFCALPKDDTGRHYGAFFGGKIVSVGSLFDQEERVRLRKFATLVEFQGKGIGSKMLYYMMESSLKRDQKEFWCDARLTAAPFYERFGFVKKGHSFEKSGETYVVMEKKLQN